MEGEKKYKYPGFECFWAEGRKAAEKAKEPIGVPFTKEEKKRVEDFHKDKIDGHIRHYPIPCVRSRRHFDLRVTQYRKVEDRSDNWIVDPDLHQYEDLEEKEFPGQKFENAKLDLLAL